LGAGGVSFSAIRIYAEEDLAVFNRMRVLCENFFHHSVKLRLDLVHDFHRFDDAKDLAFANAITDRDV
jgi:hypothetical protein